MDKKKAQPTYEWRKVLQLREDIESLVLIRVIRLSKAQQHSEYPGLSMQVLLRNPECLAFANHVYGFASSDSMRLLA